MKQKELFDYIAPQCETLSLRCEGVIAVSGDPLFDGLGSEEGM